MPVAVTLVLAAFLAGAVAHSATHSDAGTVRATYDGGVRVTGPELPELWRGRGCDGDVWRIP